MRIGQSIMGGLNKIACLAVVFALVLLSPTESHATSGQHGAHPTSSASTILTDSSFLSDLSADSFVHGFNGSDLDVGDDGQNLNQASELCCSGLCLSAILADGEYSFSSHTLNGSHIMLRSLALSYEPSDILRPPQHLI